MIEKHLHRILIAPERLRFDDPHDALVGHLHRTLAEHDATEVSALVSSRYAKPSVGNAGEPEHGLEESARVRSGWIEVSDNSIAEVNLILHAELLCIPRLLARIIFELVKRRINRKSAVAESQASIAIHNAEGRVGHLNHG